MWQAARIVQLRKREEKMCIPAPSQGLGDVAPGSRAKFSQAVHLSGGICALMSVSWAV
jgi:hypothetical protein